MRKGHINKFYEYLKTLPDENKMIKSAYEEIENKLDDEKEKIKGNIKQKKEKELFVLYFIAKYLYDIANSDINNFLDKLNLLNVTRENLLKFLYKENSIRVYEPFKIFLKKIRRLFKAEIEASTEVKGGSFFKKLILNIPNIFRPFKKQCDDKGGDYNDKLKICYAKDTLPEKDTLPLVYEENLSLRYNPNLQPMQQLPVAVQQQPILIQQPIAVQPVAVQPVAVQPVAVQPVAVQPVAVQQPVILK